MQRSIVYSVNNNGYYVFYTTLFATKCDSKKEYKKTELN